MKTAEPGRFPMTYFILRERHAPRSGKTRSRFYTVAIPEHFARGAPEEVTQAMGRVVNRLGKTATADFAALAAQQTHRRSQW